ncbi:MAG: substrate-binding domain-containing protein [Oscillospiraceae bacterium]|nr:substrate-binding domain-containing protein [Oscillospiraceae bacterium]
MARGRIAVLIPAVYDALDKEFLTGVHTAATQIGFDTLVFTSVSADNIDNYISGENNIYNLPFIAELDGIIMATNRFHDEKLKAEVLNRLEKCKVPCVVVEEKHDKIKGVFLDQKKSIYNLTEHLLVWHGYSNIICLTGPEENYEAQIRAEGFISAMEDNGLDWHGRIIYGDFWRYAPAILAEKIASGEMKCPEAVVCTNDIMAVALCQELQKHGLKVPRDVAVTGYDGSVYTLITKPAITTICGGDLCLGRSAVKTLVEMMNIDNDIDCGNVHIRIGGSCGCFNEHGEKDALLEQTEKMLHRQLDRKNFMFSNYIVRMSDCETIPKFTAVLDSLRYMLSDCISVNICLCEDWRTEHPEYRKQGFSENINLIYSENLPGQLLFPLQKILPKLNLPHDPQFWVFSSIHYSDRIIGYIATQYEKAEQFALDEHYISWCDAVANGLDIVIKKSNTEYIWQKLEEKNMTDMYTGLMSRRGFVRKLENGDTVTMISFPKRCRNMQYFVPIVSAVIRSDDTSRIAVYMGEGVFGVMLKNESYDDFAEKLCHSISELGIYITESELGIFTEKISDKQTADEQLDKMFIMISEKNVPKNSNAYSESFANIRREMKYSPQNNWNVAFASEKAGLSGSHFQRLYKKHFGISFTEELILFRLDRAKYLLRNTSMSIQQIAEECGYTNSAHFMRQFREREKVSAGQYRKAEKNE